MPGPGSRGKKKSKARPNQSINSLPGSSQLPTHTGFQLSEIDDVVEWRVIIGALCEYLQLPDLNSKSGLKKIYANFDVIYDQLEQIFEQNRNHVKVRGAIVGIFAKMSLDSLLRNKLFEKNILSKVLPLLHEDETRHLALRVLSTVTHHGGTTVRMEVSRHCNDIAKLIDDLPDDEAVAILGVSILAHSIVSVLEGDEAPANPQILKTIDMVNIVKSVLEAIKRFYSRSHSLLEHAIQIIAASTLHASYAFKAYPLALSFLAAGLRSKDWVCRCVCIGGFIRAFRMDAEDHEVPFDPRKLVANYQATGVPAHLDRLMMAYGPTKCDIYLTLSCMSESQKAIHEYAESAGRDLYALGLKQAALITKTEHAIADGYFEIEDPRTGEFVVDDMGMPFKSFRDSLHHTAEAVRCKGKAGEQDLADILEIKYLIGKQALPEVMDLARKGLRRNPEQSYFYYALSLTADNVQGLRASKKGLKCKILTPFVKYQLLHRAVDHAGDMGIKLLQSMPEHSERRWEEGVAFVMSALQDAKTYIDEAPPDSRHMKTVGYRFVLLSVLAKPDMNPDLRELDDVAKKLNIADQFSELMGIIPPKTNLRLAQQVIFKHYPIGARHFSHIFSELDHFKGVGVVKVNSTKVEDDLAAWLEDMKIEENTIDEVMSSISQSPYQPRLHLTDDTLSLYRCSWCGNPSALLRKCSGCSNVRYCDSECQKAHWKGHKIACTATSSSKQ